MSNEVDVNELYSFIDYLAEKYNIDDNDLNELDTYIQQLNGEPIEAIELNFENDGTNYEDENED